MEKEEWTIENPQFRVNVIQPEKEEKEDGFITIDNSSNIMSAITVGVDDVIRFRNDISSTQDGHFVIHANTYQPSVSLNLTDTIRFWSQ